MRGRWDFGFIFFSCLSKCSNISILDSYCFCSKTQELRLCCLGVRSSSCKWAAVSFQDENAFHTPLLYTRASTADLLSFCSVG